MRLKICPLVQPSQERIVDMDRRQENSLREKEHIREVDVDVESRIVDLNGDGADASSGGTADLPSITLLLVLYTLQGIPMGLSGSIPFLLLGKVNTEGSIYFLCTWSALKP